ncbi:hypothetical protein Tco_0350090, partial [Tanacetum coccineum]
VTNGQRSTKRLVESYNLMQRNQLVLIKQKSSATIATRQAILLESVEPREIKIVGGDMLRTLEIRIKRIEEDLAQTQREKNLVMQA